MNHADPEAVFETLDKPTCDFYLKSLSLLDDARIPYMVGGAYALAYHTGIIRHTKDLDLFVRPADALRTLQVFGDAGYRTELTFPHWLGKAFHPDDPDTFIDVIFGSGNGLALVDEQWFAHGIKGEVFDRPALICPAEEIIWQKSFVMERERFDGADVAHMLLARAPELDWHRLLRRFEGNERVLLAHLLLFTYIYPAEMGRIPEWVILRLIEIVGQEPAPRERICRGTLISRQQYLIDVHDRGFRDARLAPDGRLSHDDVKRWTDAIGTIK